MSNCKVNKSDTCVSTVSLMSKNYRDELMFIEYVEPKKSPKIGFVFCVTLKGSGVLPVRGDISTKWNLAKVRNFILHETMKQKKLRVSPLSWIWHLPTVCRLGILIEILVHHQKTVQKSQKSNLTSLPKLPIYLVKLKVDFWIQCGSRLVRIQKSTRKLMLTRPPAPSA